MSAAARRRADLIRAEQEALVRRADGWMLRIDDIRAAKGLAAEGSSQRQIADVLHTTPPRVHRMLKAAKALGDEPGPEEIILRAAVDHLDREELVRTRSRCRFAFRDRAPEPFDSRAPAPTPETRSAPLWRPAC